MKFNKKNKKGFTIVELVIVIAVIGVLTAVLIPTFVNLTNRAKEAENQTFVRNLNTQMGIREATEGKNKTMYEAMMEAEDIGYNVEKLTPVNGNDVVWDSVANRFAIVASDFDPNSPDEKKVVYSDGGIKATKKTELWKIYAEMPAPADQTYSIYAKEGWKVSEVENLKVGFDAGKNAGIATVSYVGNSYVSSIRESIEGRTPKMVSSQGQEVVIRTDGGTLTIDAATDDVKHYGMVKYLTVTAVNSENCYHEFGYVGNLGSFGTGKFVAEASAVFHQTKEEIAEKLNGKTFELKDGAQYGKHYFDPETGACEIDNCDEVDPDNPNTPPSDGEEGIEGVTPKIKIVEGENGALNLDIDKSDMGEYADQVSYYEIVFSTKVAVNSEAYKINEEYEFELAFDSRANAAIPYIGWSCDYPSNMPPAGSKNDFKTSNDLKYELISDADADYIPFRKSVWIVSDSIVQKAMIENHNISVGDSVSCVFSYSDYKYHFYINLTNEEYQALCDVYGDSKDVFKAVENQNGKYEIDVEAGVDYEDYSNYAIKAYKSDGTLLGKTTYKNAYSQWKDNEKIVVVSEGYESNFLNSDENIIDTLGGNSNTFGYYRYVLETRETKTTYWTDKVEDQ